VIEVLEARKAVELSGEERPREAPVGEVMWLSMHVVTPHVSKPHDYVNHMFKRP
jgi:hypothetical protein